MVADPGSLPESLEHSWHGPRTKNGAGKTGLLLYIRYKNVTQKIKDLDMNP